MVTLQVTLPSVSVDALLERYGEGSRRASIAPIYHAMLAEAERLAAPALLQTEFSRAEVLELADWLPPHTDAVVLAICTLGPALEARTTALFPSDAAAAVVLDEIGVAQLTALTREIHGEVKRNVAARGLRAGPAYRPGVGRWPLETQRLVFDQLPAHEIGVRLGETLIMSPGKSNSLVIPIRKTTNSRKEGRDEQHS